MERFENFSKSEEEDLSNEEPNKAQHDSALLEQKMSLGSKEQAKKCKPDNQAHSEKKTKKLKSSKINAQMWKHLEELEAKNKALKAKHVAKPPPAVSIVPTAATLGE